MAIVRASKRVEKRETAGQNVGRKTPVERLEDASREKGKPCWIDHIETIIFGASATNLTPATLEPKRAAHTLGRSDQVIEIAFQEDTTGIEGVSRIFKGEPWVKWGTIKKIPKRNCHVGPGVRTEDQRSPGVKTVDAQADVRHP